jgi:hypothetical protein
MKKISTNILTFKSHQYCSMGCFNITECNNLMGILQYPLSENPRDFESCVRLKFLSFVCHASTIVICYRKPMATIDNISP